MSDYYNKLLENVRQRFAGKLRDSFVQYGQLTLVIDKSSMLEILKALRDESAYACEELVDLCGVDYSEYRDGQWQGERYAVAYHLLSVKNNHRMRVRVMTDGEPPRVASVISIWSSANWFEREAFDLYGIVFDGHPDLRRILTDYGFVGHPFRKDFPLIGNVEMRYDPEKKRVIYQPVSIDARVNQPRVIRDDHRYADRQVSEGEIDA